MDKNFDGAAPIDIGVNKKENFVLGLLCGIAAAVLGAGIWMGIEVAVRAQFGLIAIAVGALVGFAIRWGGRGTGMVYGVMGAILTLVSCVSGEILAIAQMASTPGRDLFVTLSTMNFSETLTALFSHMSVMGYVIYGIGIYEGYKFSFRK